MHQINNIIKLYQHKSIKAIAKTLNIPAKNITLILKQNNITIKPSHSYTSSNLKDQIIVDFWQQKLNYQQIANKNNCSISLVKKIIMLHVKEHNLPCYVCNSHQNLYKNNKRQIICTICQVNISAEKRKLSNQRRSKKRQLDPCKKISHNFSSILRNQLKNNNVTKQCNTFFSLDYSSQDLKLYLESKFESWMNWDNYGKYNSKSWNDNDQSTWTWQIDHIQPVSTFQFSSTNDPGFKLCWSLDNLRPLSSKQNYLDGVRRIRHK